MGHFHSCKKLWFAWIGILALFVPFTFLCDSARALTASAGRPYQGHLVNGVPFPAQFRGYQLRNNERIYTTPEVVGGVLDAIDAVQKQFPNTCDVYLGDFSGPDGGSINHHRSHQNGRDVDVGMYAKGNRMLDTFMPMNEANLDVAKTWCFMENILRTQRIQYIFLDRRVQKLLYDYAQSRGVDETYLNRLFGNSKGAIVQHVVHHQDHMHVRFYTPWSTLASRVGETESQKRMVIELAQQAYLPKKVNYYAHGNERGLDALAQSFGVSRRDLCRWNQLSPGDVLTPGSCLVFYKRSFEVEPVHLAQSLHADLMPSVRLASFRSSETLSDAPISVPPTSPPPAVEKKQEPPAVQSYVVKRGDTLAKIAREKGVDLKSLCEMNRLKPTSRVRPGQKLRMATAKPSIPYADAKSSKMSASPATPPAVVAAPAAKGKSSTVALHTVGKGDTLRSISQKHGVDVADLCRANGLGKDSVLKRGQKILLASAEEHPISAAVSAKSSGAVTSSGANTKLGKSDKSGSSNHSSTSKSSAALKSGSAAKQTASSKSTSSTSSKVKSATSAPAQKIADSKKNTDPKKNATKTKAVQNEKSTGQPLRSAKLDSRKRAN
jgi:LysM repeat protein/murein endopeptidase